MPIRTLPVSVLVLSDFERGRKTWADEIACVASLARDPHARPAEILVLAPSADFAGARPPAWSNSDVPIRVHAVKSGSSTNLKNEGVRLAEHDLIAVVEADSPCEPGWRAARHSAASFTSTSFPGRATKRNSERSGEYSSISTVTSGLSRKYRTFLP
jgi:hypothetical protein